MAKLLKNKRIASLDWQYNPRLWLGLLLRHHGANNAHGGLLTSRKAV